MQWRYMRDSLVGSFGVLGIIGVRNSARTPATLVVDPTMASRAPVVGVTAGLSRRDNPFILLKSLLDKNASPRIERHVA